MLTSVLSLPIGDKVAYQGSLQLGRHDVQPKLFEIPPNQNMTILVNIFNIIDFIWTPDQSNHWSEIPIAFVFAAPTSNNNGK